MFTEQLAYPTVTDSPSTEIVHRHAVGQRTETSELQAKQFFTAETQSSQSSEYLSIENSLLCALSVSAVSFLLNQRSGQAFAVKPHPTKILPSLDTLTALHYGC